MDPRITRDVADKTDVAKLRDLIASFDVGEYCELLANTKPPIIHWPPPMSLPRLLQQGLAYKHPYSLSIFSSLRNPAVLSGCPPLRTTLIDLSNRLEEGSNRPEGITTNQLKEISNQLKEMNHQIEEMSHRVEERVNQREGRTQVAGDQRYERYSVRAGDHSSRCTMNNRNAFQSTNSYTYTINGPAGTLPDGQSTSERNRGVGSSPNERATAFAVSRGLDKSSYLSNDVPKSCSDCDSSPPLSARFSDEQTSTSDTDNSTTATSQSSVDIIDRHSGVIMYLSFARDSEYFPRTIEWPDSKLHRVVSEWICQIDYSHLDLVTDIQLRQELPQIVCPLGHLVFFGRITTREGPPKSIDEYCTPSWFTVVVDLLKPDKPVWLIFDRRYLGWDDEPYDSSDDEYGIPDNDGNTLYPPPIWEASPELPATEFFDKLSAGGVDVIRLFSSISELGAVPWQTVGRNLFEEKSRCEAGPSLRYLLTGDIRTHVQAGTL